MITSIKVSCEHPQTIVNRRYSKLGKPLQWRFSSNVDYYLQVPCGRCRLCRKRTAKEWKVRLSEELKHTRSHSVAGRRVPRCVFVTLTISDKYYADDDKFFAPWLKKFRDNYRKKYGKSPRYWCITDRGSQFARLHLHMLLFDPRYYEKKTKTYTSDVSITNLLKNKFWWPYGFVNATWVKSSSVSNYVAGYVTNENMYNDEPVKHGKPICEKSLQYTPKVFPSKGIGKGYLTENTIETHRENGQMTISLDGYMYGLPRYYKTNIFSEDYLYYAGLFHHIDVMDYYDTHRHPSSIRYNYENSIFTENQLKFTTEQNKRFLTPSKPKYDLLDSYLSSFIGMKCIDIYIDDDYWFNPSYIGSQIIDSTSPLWDDNKLF